jgi:FMNH2-dependent dimethyl sulfone monooxygenase
VACPDLGRHRKRILQRSEPTRRDARIEGAPEWHHHRLGVAVDHDARLETVALQRLANPSPLLRRAPRGLRILYAGKPEARGVVDLIDRIRGRGALVVQRTRHPIPEVRRIAESPAHAAGSSRHRVNLHLDGPLAAAALNENRFKLGIFCMNVSHGTTMTTAPGALTPTWAENVRIARAADRAGWEFLLPLGRWRGFGGDLNFDDKSFEVYTWAAGIAAVTTQIQVFTTSHIRMVHPVMAAKQGCTIDHIAGGRSALNVVAGQKPEEIAMFGIEQIPHDDAYDAADEWLTMVKRLWTEDADLDFAGTYLQAKGAHAMPKPLQRPYPVIVNAGSSPRGRLFGAKHADFSFLSLPDVEQLGALAADCRDVAWREYKRKLGTFTHGYVVCRDTEKEAQDYLKYYVDECGDWGAAEGLIKALLGAKSQSIPPETLVTMQRAFISGWGGIPFVGTAEQIVEQMQGLADAGLDGAALHWVDYEEGLERFNRTVLPLMIQAGLRKR